MTWVLYQQTVEALEGPALRKFLVEADDIEGLRAYDKKMLKESNLGARGA